MGVSDPDCSPESLMRLVRDGSSQALDRITRCYGERLLDAGRLKVVMIDGDEAPELAANLSVRGYPTFLCVRGGEIVAHQPGFGGKRAFEALTQSLLEA